MDGSQVDLSIIEATDEYSARTVPTPASGNGVGNSVTVAEARIRHLESELEKWQRRTVIWRERALSAQALNEAMTKNLEDLRTLLQLVSVRPIEDDAMAVQVPSVRRPSATEAVSDWLTRVFRRDFGPQRNGHTHG